MKAGKVPPRLAGESDAEGKPAPVTPKVIAEALRTGEGRDSREPPERAHPSSLPISRTFPSPTEATHSAIAPPLPGLQPWSPPAYFCLYELPVLDPL